MTRRNLRDSGARRAGMRPRARRRRRLADALLALAAFGALAVVAARAPLLVRPHETLHGPARVADGDSLVVGGVRVRLEGIDAPELAQTCTRGGRDYACGREAQAALARLAAGGTVSCEGSGRDRYGRVLARCTAGTIELNRAMVEAGWAVAYGDYGAQETAARRAGRGLWAGSFERPQEWRRVHGGLAEAPHGGLSAVWGWLRGLFGF